MHTFYTLKHKLLEINFNDRFSREHFDTWRSSFDKLDEHEIDILKQLTWLQGILLVNFETLCSWRTLRKRKITNYSFKSVSEHWLKDFIEGNLLTI